MKMLILLTLATALFTLCGAYTNVSLNAKTRSFLKHMQTFVDDMDPEAKPFTPALSTSGIRAYGLKSNKMICIYIVAVKDSTYRQTIKGATVQVQGVIKKAKAYWYDPLKGDTVSIFSVERGSHKLTIPDFKEDIALKLHLLANTSAIKYKCTDSKDTICMYYEQLTPPFAPADNGAQVYFDRNYLISDISDNLRGMTVLPTQCGSKTAKDDSVFWSFTLDKKCDVYIGFSGSPGRRWDIGKIKWLKSWKKVDKASLTWQGHLNGNTYTDTHTIWYKKKGKRFDMRGQNGGPVNYLVLVDGVVEMTGSGKTR
jgi:hypothetical protein